MKGLKASFSIKILQDGGHYPMETTALAQLTKYTDEFIQSIEQLDKEKNSIL
ncbi:MAG TPA: hypothetical protein PLJ37_07300 [Chitinophagales bacterium]|nr:hypothetical protein [Chitinophagales bacterium]HMV03882.1 hypothetical protein [Chitinophagales bacterium]HMW94894.1 hypothetical protein [Chitinophagales bacterium]HMY42849.1 hypothetical protein [Chitinophagales bacterium]HNB38759.1 hypothetical protein [Chitinophagales bacterium]